MNQIERSGLIHTVSAYLEEKNPPAQVEHRTFQTFITIRGPHLHTKPWRVSRPFTLSSMQLTILNLNGARSAGRSTEVWIKPCSWRRGEPAGRLSDGLSTSGE